MRNLCCGFSPLTAEVHGRVRPATGVIAVAANFYSQSKWPRGHTHTPLRHLEDDPANPTALLIRLVAFRLLA